MRAREDAIKYAAIHRPRISIMKNLPRSLLLALARRQQQRESVL